MFYPPSDRFRVLFMVQMLFLLGLILVLGPYCAGAVRGRAP